MVLIYKRLDSQGQNPVAKAWITQPLQKWIQRIYPQTNSQPLTEIWRVMSWTIACSSRAVENGCLKIMPVPQPQKRNQWKRNPDNFECKYVTVLFMAQPRDSSTDGIWKHAPKVNDAWRAAGPTIPALQPCISAVKHKYKSAGKYKHK